ncbi:MAG: glucose 1-dehydrogenase [Candidatus Latescibacteria bacterium]|nr:glucose 1-dehydrogenase [Candidatus Latescibacterota bacterium]
MILDTFKLTDRVALVTGASQGLGEAIAVAFAEAGADVVLASRNLAKLEAVASRITALGRTAVPVQMDVSLRADHDRAVAAALDRWGRIDILVNDAGTNVRVPAEDFREDDWDVILNTNLKGTFFLTQLVGRQMIAQRRGKIINIASLTSITGLPNLAAYTASKGGIASLTRMLAIEWAKHGITVNAICPGYIKTPLTQAVLDSPRGAYIESRVPIGRWGVPDDIAGTAVFLASGASDFMTGQLVVVDGGWMAG